MAKIESQFNSTESNEWKPKFALGTKVRVANIDGHFVKRDFEKYLGKTGKVVRAWSGSRRSNSEPAYDVKIRGVGFLGMSHTVNFRESELQAA